MDLTIVVPRRSWLEISLWKTGKGRKKRRAKKRREMVFQAAELDRRDQVTATNSWPNFPSREGSKVDNQVAAPTETSTPNWHRAIIAQQRVRMEGWRQGGLAERENGRNCGKSKKNY
jgi:hypothetical protein